MSVTARRVVVARQRAASARMPAWTRLLLACGITSSVLYFGMDLLAATLYDGYSYRDQTISELSAIGASTRAMWIPLGLIYSALTLAFGVGVWRSTGAKRALRVVAIAIVGMGIVGLVGWPFAPMHQREVLAAGGGTAADTMHLVLAAVNTFLFVLCIAAGAGAFGVRFRIYSLSTLAAVLVFGALTGLNSPNVAADEPTPWLGVTERTAVLGSMLWMAVLSVVLLRLDGLPEGARNAAPGH
jgi:hypothetical protein